METRLKERLVGAIVLVAIVVIVVPELLTGPRRGAGTATDVAPSAGTPVRVVTINMESGNHTTEPPAERAPAPLLPAPAPASAGGEAAAVPPSADVSRGSAPVPAPLANDAATPSPSVATPPADEPPKFAAATPAAAKPAEARKPADVPKTADAPKFADAPRTVDAPKSTDGAKAAGTAKTSEPTKPAETPKPATRATAPGAGWVVQLGSFASRPNAEKLVAELRQAGYTAFVSEFRGSGKVLYRVRVGPEQDRARADALAQRLARDGRKGTVAPHP